ncbi:uncharacterized protein LOC123685903 isoform X2 [Harmonia axyridis]|uniref:uncharacterized protein LOC123685903 isoform X2 n=1 Tax=Harmonia axyridis TaxID=115357 RepID=UPI001E276156|nr:uncharacterized protein LOC123685903 isoform X2 [Harmonia axyridis]
MNNEVVQFYQKAIIDSGLVLDEDLIFIRSVECKVSKSKADISRNIIILATALGTTYYAMKTGDVGVTVLNLPAAFSFLMSCYYSRRSKNQKDLISHLLTEFKNLSRIHSEVNEFLKRFNFSMNSSKNTFIKMSEDTITGLSKYSCDIQASITKMMLSIISEIHVGLQDVSLDLTDFEKAIAVSLNHDTVMECLQNAHFIEGQVVLLRSHLLTSIFLISSSKGDGVIFIRVMDKGIPSLASLIQNSVNGIKAKLNETRFPYNPPSFSLSSIENTFAQREMLPNKCFPRMRKHVFKINDGICCTLIKLKSLFETVETIESEYGMEVLQEAVSNLTQELYKCYTSSADLEKLIQLLNRKINTQTSIDESQENFVTALTSDTTRPEMEELAEDSDYQVFSNDVNDADNECEAVRFYKRLMKNDVDWLAELKQSDEFQKRQNKFGTGAPVTSTPVDQHPQTEKHETTLSESATSLEGLKRPPLPETPEFKDFSSPEIQLIPTQPSIPTPPSMPLTIFEGAPPPAEPSLPLIPLSFLEDSSLKDSLQFKTPPTGPLPSTSSSSPNLSQIMLKHPPPPETPATPLSPLSEPSLVRLSLLEDSSLKDSLKSALERMGTREEENYE